MNFDASKIEDFTIVLKATLNHIAGSFGGFGNFDGFSLIFNDLSYICQSEDSNLSQTCMALSSICDEISQKISECYESIENGLKKYAIESIANEESTNKSLNDINEELESINSILEGI